MEAARIRGRVAWAPAGATSAHSKATGQEDQATEAVHQTLTSARRGAELYVSGQTSTPVGLHCRKSMAPMSLRRDPAAPSSSSSSSATTAAALGLAGPSRARSVGAVHGRGDAPAQAVLPRARAPAASAGDHVPEDVPHGRHRHHRHDQPASDVLRDARQLLVRRLLQAARPSRFAWDLSTQGFGFSPDDIWITVFAGDDELGLGPDEEAIEAWLEIGVPRERIVECPALGELLAGRPDRSVRPVLGAVPGPRPRVRQARRSARRRQRALPRVLEPRVHAVRSEPGEHADAAAGQEHRHGPGPQPAGADPAGHAVGVRDRPVRAADRAGRGALRAAATARTTRPIGGCGCWPTTAAR